MKRYDEKMDLHLLVEKIKKRNFDLEKVVLSSLHNQSSKEFYCTICKEEIEIEYGNITEPCECKSIKRHCKKS